MRHALFLELGGAARIEDAVERITKAIGPELATGEAKLFLLDDPAIAAQPIAPQVAPTAAPRPGVMCIHETERSFQIDGEARVILRRRHAPWLVLKRLAEERQHAPGHGLSVEELVAAGWPGETILPSAAASRLYFVIRELRKAGLERVLLTVAEGYMLDPSIPLEWSRS
jgi:hypothetical protein